ncbi:DHH family phosphoesterase [Candidatus Micrarchaeota archaeon]|nr:DHH family phosphoesterase [Candidatus Micrarchaeota archaeon]
MKYQTSLDFEPPKNESPKDRDYAGFEKRAREIGDIVLGMNNPVIVHHYDCDGLSSGAIVCLARKLVGKQYSNIILKKIGEEEIDSLPKSEEYVFVDLGCGYADKLREKLGGKIAIIDHHPPVEADVEQINAHYHGFDGGTAVSAASTAAYCFKHLGDARIYQLGIVGAVGDMQDSEGGFKDLNKKLVEEAASKGFVEVRKDLRLFGKMSRPLTQFLSYCTEPILPGLTGKSKNCAVFLENNSIQVKQGNAYIAYYDLNDSEKKRFISALVNYALQKKVPEKAVKEMIGDIYLFPFEETRVMKEAYEFSTLLNACGRHDQGDLGVSVCLGEKEKISDAEKLLLEHRKEISIGINYAQENFMDFGEFYFFDGRGKISDTVIGSIAGAFLGSGIVEASKPIIAFSLDDKGKTKVSSRGNKTLVEKGLDLGQVMKTAGLIVNGVGGGHKPAAGCTFDTSKENDEKFLLKAKEVLKTQLFSN